MADYINRDKVLVELECGIRAGNYEKGYEKYMHINSMDDCFDTVKYFDTVDVVEREKYDLLQRGYEILKHQLEKSWDRIDELDKLNGSMRDKIDKSIAEMREEYDNFTYSANKTLGASFGIRKAIEILEKNLGE